MAFTKIRLYGGLVFVELENLSSFARADACRAADKGFLELFDSGEYRAQNCSGNPTFRANPACFRNRKWVFRTAAKFGKAEIGVKIKRERALILSQDISGWPLTQRTMANLFVLVTIRRFCYRRLIHSILILSLVKK